MEDCVRKRIAIAVMGLLVLGGTASAALGAPKKSNGQAPNTYGLCTANHNGNKNGWGATAPPPFQALQTQGELHESQSAQLGEANSGTENTAADARQDINQACVLDGIVPGGQGHGFPD